MRLVAQFSAQKPSVEQTTALLPLIEGAEIKALAAPYKNTGHQVNIDTLSLDWGQFVGSIPSTVHLVAKLSDTTGRDRPRTAKAHRSRNR